MDHISATSHLRPLLNLLRSKEPSSPSTPRSSQTVTFTATTEASPPSNTSSTSTTTATNETTMSSPTTTQPTTPSAPTSPTSAPQKEKEPLHTPPSPFRAADLTLLTQGAEALVYRTTHLTSTSAIALKYRPAKPWRHRALDARLTRARILAEARVLVKCRRDGVAVPAVLGLDWEAGWLALEWIAGRTVRRSLDLWFKERGGEVGDEVHGLLARVGAAVAKLHSGGVVHGDLTTSNIMVRPWGSAGDEEEGSESQGLEGEVVLIDFGLAGQSTQDEDKAVDLYVLERAFGSTHPEAETAFGHVLEAYGASYKGGKAVLKRLEDVRMRGRKKSMLG